MTTWALDLDGVLWRGKEPISGSAAGVAKLRSAGHQVVFVTNNSFATIADQEAKLGAFGILAGGDVISSAMAGAQLVAPGDRVFVLGGPGIREAIVARGATLLDVPEPGSSSADAVVVGLDWDLSYDRLRAAVQAVSGGARFIATNTDSTYPTERGFFPGAGAVVAAVAAATGREPEVAGKPEAPIAALVRARYGDEGIMVGDRPETDGAFARTLGYRFGLVLSGVTQPGDLPVIPAPDIVAADLGSLVALHS
jgi:HAD superfamily hydrolase (TIGR01450 family)